MASVTGQRDLPGGDRSRGRATAPRVRRADGVTVELADAVEEALLGLGDNITKVENRTYRAYQRLRNFACVCPSQRTKLLVYLKADPKEAELIPGFTPDVTGIGHHGTGDLELQLRTDRDLERAQECFRLSYAAA